jgi:hypothetical protein
MKKMLKIMAMLLVIATVVFAAGCADKKTGNDTNQEAAQEVTNQSVVADENVTESSTAANVTAENDSADDNLSVVDDNLSVVDDDSADENVSVVDNNSADVNVSVVDNSSNETTTTTA